MATSRKTKSSKAAATKSSSKKVKKKAATARTVKKKSAGDKGPSTKRAASKAKASGAGKKKTAATSAKKKSAKSKPPKPAKPAKPRKPSVDPTFINTIREALVRQKRQLVEMMQTTQAQMAEKQTGLADLVDQATEGFEDELSLGLLKIEAAQIEEIIAAIERIDAGSYGLCEDCGKPIPRKRLEILPFALRCLNCKGTHERQARIKGKFEEDD